MEWKTIELPGDGDFRRLIVVRNCGGRVLVEFEAFHDYVQAGEQAARWLCKLFGASKIAGVARVLYPQPARCTWCPSSRMPSIIGKQRLGMDTTTIAGTKIMFSIPWLLVCLLACNKSTSKRSKSEKMKT